MKKQMPTLHVQNQIVSIISSSKNTVMCLCQPCQQQIGGIDCGLFTIAFAVDLYGTKCCIHFVQSICDAPAFAQLL